MALLHNTTFRTALLGRHMAGRSAYMPLSQNVRGEKRNWSFGEHTPDKKSGTPDGCLAPASLNLPVYSGGMASRNFINGSSSTTFSGNLGLNAQAGLTGSGDITSATAQLVISMVANLTGSGAVSLADLRGYLNAVANLSGSGGITSTLSAMAWATAAVSGSGTASGTATALGTLAATIRGYSDLTPEGIRDNVWNATASAYNTSGTMGQKLNSAASGGVDLDALAAAVWAYATRTLTSGGGGATAADIWSYATRTLTAGSGSVFATPVQYKASSTTTTADPGTGKLRWNNATQISATEIYLDSLTNDGIDITNYLAVLPAGSTLFVQDKDDAAKYQKWLINSAVDNTGWATFGVSLLASAGGNITNNQVTVLVFNSSTMTSAPTAAENAQAVLDAAQITPIHADMKKTNGEDLIGDGTPGDRFRSHLVPVDNV